MKHHRKLSRRDFCWAMCVGGTMLSLPVLKAGLAHGQNGPLGDDVAEDDPEYLDLVSADTDADGFNDTVLPSGVDDPDPIDPTDVPEFYTSIFPPLIINQGTHVSTVNALAHAVPAEASQELLAAAQELSNRDRALQFAITQLG